MQSFLHRRHFVASSLIWSQKFDCGFEAIPCSAWQGRGTWLARCRLVPRNLALIWCDHLVVPHSQRFPLSLTCKGRRLSIKSLFKPILFNCPYADHLFGSARRMDAFLYETRLIRLHKLSASEPHLQFFHSFPTSSHHPLSLICDHRKNFSTQTNRLFSMAIFSFAVIRETFLIELTFIAFFHRNKFAAWSCSISLGCWPCAMSPSLMRYYLLYLP